MSPDIGPSRYIQLKGHLLNPKVETCPHCETKMSPPRDICLGCNQGVDIEEEISGRGKVYSYTTVFQAPEGYVENVPFN